MLARFFRPAAALSCIALGACLPEENTDRIGVGEAASGGIAVFEDDDDAGVPPVETAGVMHGGSGGSPSTGASNDYLEFNLVDGLHVLTIEKSTLGRGSVDILVEKVLDEPFRVLCPVHVGCHVGVNYGSEVSAQPEPEDGYRFDVWTDIWCPNSRGGCRVSIPSGPEVRMETTLKPNFRVDN